MGLYPIFADLGYFDEKELNKFGTTEGFLRIFGNISIPGIDCTAGSLGHGLGVGSGYAFSYKYNSIDLRTFFLPQRRPPTEINMGCSTRKPTS